MADGSARGGAIPMRSLRLVPYWSVHETLGVDAHNAPPEDAHTPDSPIPCGRLELRSSPPGRRCRTGQHGRGGERPPSPRAWYGLGARCVFTHLPPPSWGRSRSRNPLREGKHDGRTCGLGPTRLPSGRPSRCSGPDMSRARVQGRSWLPPLGRSRYILVRSLQRKPP